MKNNIGVCVLLIFLAFSCKNENQIASEIAMINIEVDVERFDRMFSQSQPEDLSELKAAYPFMFSSRFTDQDWIDRLQDTLQIQIHNEVNRMFSTFEEEEDDIRQLFKHLKYYYKEFKTPRVITVTNDVDYRNKSIVTDTIVLIALDNYLGPDHEFYGGIQNYLRKNFKREMIVSDLAEAYAKQLIFQSETNTFLDDMIYFGKLLYFKDQMIPFVQDELKIGYTKSELEWAKVNESNIWSNFIENELLYSTDPKLQGRFIRPAPFSKFNLGLDRESPGRIGCYIGWQIVKAYMENNTVEFKQMLTKDADEIFRNSKFKPEK